jgi:hypothetical protein
MEHVPQTKDCFFNKVKEYVENNPNIGIVFLTPCYGGMAHVSYMTSLINTMNVLKIYGIKSFIQFTTQESLISRGRNSLVASAMANPETTHLMFVDADIVWSAVEILKLVIADKEIVGGLYPKKSYDWNNVSKVCEKLKSSNTLTAKTIQQHLVTYNFNPISRSLSIENNLTEVKHLATGFMMLKRSLIEEMEVVYKDTKYTDKTGHLRTEEEQKHCYALFDCCVKNQDYLSEDWYFCERVREMDKSIFIDITIDLSHLGTIPYVGSFRKYLFPDIDQITDVKSDSIEQNKTSTL